MHKTYKNPPLIEAICELRFGLDTPYTQDQVTTFYQMIKDNFSIQKKGKMHKLEFAIDASKTNEENRNNINQGFYEFEQFFSDDEKYSVQLDMGRVSIHRVKPYISWTEFFPLIKNVSDSYINCFSPNKLLRIGVRYVNEIIVPKEEFSFDDYFNIKVTLPSLVEKSKKSLFIGSVFGQEEDRDAIKVQFAEKQILEPILSRVFILDFDYFLVNPIVEFSEIDNWLEKAHTNLETVFEGIVTDKVKSLFDK